MPLRRGSSGPGLQRNRSVCCRVPFAILLFFAVAPLLFLIGRSLHTTTTATIDPNGIQTGNVQNLDWREWLAMQYFTSIFSKEVFHAWRDMGRGSKKCWNEKVASGPYIASAAISYRLLMLWKITSSLFTESLPLVSVVGVILYQKQKMSTLCMSLKHMKL
ncbi:uncharacterized protein LOC122081025 [Macadamia integrifolia]|uniref:uncharacterized protein LOC122081025 n=1 Tax=Macadamia integrifolia TaxID=60698 RepID=UPI001C4ED1D3|nr:uncharacterized protein LOC122081025 [Macadamia integrifolia]XP_042503896.1 uncharacterized protein LOC122081025 [Macadamia integrifolia]